MSCWTAQQWFTFSQAELQPLGHSYPPGTEETVKWGNNFKQTAPGRLLSMLLVIQQGINAMLPVSHPGHITLCVTRRRVFGSHEHTPCVGTFCCDRAAVPAVSEGLPLPAAVPNILAWHRCCTMGQMTSQQTSKLLRIHWKIKGNWNSWAAPKKLCKKFSPKAYHISSYHIWLQVFMNMGDFF